MDSDAGKRQCCHFWPPAGAAKGRSKLALMKCVVSLRQKSSSLTPTGAANDPLALWRSIPTVTFKSIPFPRFFLLRFWEILGDFGRFWEILGDFWEVE